MMRTRTSAAAAALALVLSACSAPPSSAPALSSVEPSSTPSGAETAMVIHGAGFAAQVQVDFDAPAASRVASQYALTLRAGDARVPLTGVRLVSDSRLSATLPAGATSPGTYDLELVDPQGRTLLLASAMRVYTVSCAHDGDPCDDGDSCTDGENCQAGACVSPPSHCTIGPSTNRAPLPCFTVGSTDGLSGSLFTFDASCSSDAEDGQDGKPLQVRWYFDGPGGTPTAFSTSAIATHVFDVPSTYQVVAEVRDSGGLSSFTSQLVLVTASSDAIWVTTGQDEGDEGATPASQGGTGLSLREAIVYVNKLGAARTIRFGTSVTTVSLQGDAGHGPLKPLTAAGAAIVGRPDLTLDFGGILQPCLTLGATNQLLLGLRMIGCADVGVLLDGSSAGSQVADCTIADSPTAYGIQGEASGIIGPGNALSGLSTGIRVVSPGYTIDGNRIHHNGGGMELATAPATVQRNLVYKNAEYGLQVTSTLPASAQAPTQLYFNVVDSNGTSGVTSGQAVLVVRNNLLTRNGQYGLAAGASVTADHNGLFGNHQGPVSGGSVGADDLVSDPAYVDAAAGDYRLTPSSPALDRGIDVGLDVNGPALGNYDGAAPDLGAFELPPSGSAP